VNRKPIVPPGGFAGLNQQTPATQALFSGAVKKKATRKRRKVARKKAPTRRRKVAKKARRAAGAKRLVKGSAAAKRHMARLRAMRKKKRAR
jgi:hypothetical protein